MPYKPPLTKLHSITGFTLIEVMIATSLFAMIVLVGFSTYVSITRLEQSNIRSQKVYSESRFWLDMLSYEIQTGQIASEDTAGNPYPVTVGEAELIIIDRQGFTVRYFRDPIEDSLKKEISPPGGIDILSSPEIRVTKLDFYIQPLSGASGVPLVTILWQAQDLNKNKPIIFNAQTSVSGRTY